MTPADYFRQQQEKADQAVKHAALLASQPLPKTPDEYAQSARLAKSMAMPTAVIDPQYKTFAQKMTERRNEMILSTAPVLTGWVATGDNYRVAADDLEGLSWFEGFGQGLWNTARRAGERAGLMYEQGMLEHTAGRARDRTMTFGQIIDDEREVIKGASGREVKAWARPGDLLSAFARWADARYADLVGFDDAGNARDYAAQVEESRKAIAAIPKSQIATTFEKQAMAEGSSLGETLANFGKALARNPIGALSWALETAGESAPTLAAAAGVTAVTRNPVAGVAAMGAGSYATERFTSPSEFFTEKGLDLSKPEDVTRLLADPKLMKEAKDRGVIRGAVIGAFDAVSGGVAGKALAGNPLVEALAQGAAQAVMGSSGEYAARLAAGQEIDWNEIVAEGVAEIATAPIDMGIAGRSFVRDRRAAAHAEERVAQIKKLSSAAQASALRNRLPDGFRDYLDQALADGPVENVYVPAQDFVTYFQSQGIDPWELTDDLDGVTRDDLDAALAGGGDLQIPTATYAAKIAGSEADPFFMENMRFSPDEMTAREAAEFNDRAQDVMAEAWNEAERIRVEDEALRGIEEAIYVEMQSRLRRAGRTTDVANSEAMLYPAFYRVMAERSGMTTEEFLARYPLPRVEGVRPEGMQTKDVTAFNRTLAEARAPRRKVKQGQSLLEFIADRGGINDVGGELKARDAQVVKRGRGKKNLRLARDTSGAGQAAMFGGGRSGGAFGPDDVAQAAIEAGFMADNTDALAYKEAMRSGGEVPDITRALWDAIDRELRGEPQYSAGVQDDGTADTNTALDQVEEYLASLGVSLDDSDADILAAVRQDEEGRRYGQGEALPETIEVDGVARPTTNSEGQPLASTEAGVRSFWRWFGDSKVVDGDGKPLVVYHGTGADFEAFADDALRSGGAHWFSDAKTAEGYARFPDGRKKPGAKVLGFYVSSTNPFIYDAGGRNYLNAVIHSDPLAVKIGARLGTYVEWRGDSIRGQSINELAAWSALEGYDGLIVSNVVDQGSDAAAEYNITSTSYAVFNPTQIKSVNNRGTFDPNDARILYQDGQADQPLYVVHNLSADKLHATRAVGGLAAPSLAVARGDIGFDSFGEISLIGDPSLANPKAKGVRLFSADVYSPRQPRARFKVNEKARRAMRSLLAPAAEKIGLDLDRARIGQDDIERGGLSEVEMTDAAKAAWLEAKGEALPIVYQEAKAPEAPAGLGNFTATDEAELLADPAFMQRMQRKYELAVKWAEGNADLTARINEAWLDDSGNVSPDAVPARNLAKQVAEYNRTIADFKPGKTDKIDSYRTSDALTQAIGDRMPEYRDWVRAQFGDVVGPAFFEDANGRKREYTLANLVREMTRELRNGENWNYGAGNVRAAVAPEFKTLADVKDARGQITSDAEMKALKDEVNSELFALADKFAPYHSSGQDFGWADIFTDFLKDVAKGERAVAAWQTQWFSSPVPDELIDEARAFLDKLKTLPTNYFEIKMQRAMTLDEFTAALVPSDLSAEARAILTDAGLQLVEYDRKAEGGRNAALQQVGGKVFFQSAYHGSPHLFDKFSTSAIGTGEGVRSYEQNMGNGPRGSVQFPAAGVGNGDTIIRLSERADLSTFLHESGHYFLTVLQDMAAKGEPSAVAEFANIKGWWRENAEAVAADARKAFPELAVTADHVTTAIDTGTSGDAAIDAAIDVGMQEQWARGFEQYVMEGKAPSVELRSAFERFRAWLLSIYRKLTGLNVNVSDDLRRVFDRMLATDEEIASANVEVGGTGALFTTAEEMGLTDVEFERFQKLRAQAEEEAKARLLAETMAPIRREREKWYREERAAVREQVEREINTRPEYRAIEWLGNRRWLGDGQPEAMPDMRLSRDILVERYGAGILKTLPRGKYPVYAVDGGVDPDDVAGWFGFDSGDEMLQAMERATPRKQAIEAETDKRMYDTHGDVLRDGSVEEAALAAVHGEKRARVLALELDALNRKIGKDQPTRARQVREIARRTISRMRVRDAMNSKRFLAAERKAATAAYRAVAEGNIEEAAAQKYRQLLNHSLYAEARLVEEDVGKAERFVAGLNKASKREKIAGAGRRENAQIDYLGAIDEILERYDFRRLSGRAEGRRGALNAFVDAMRAAGRENELAIPDAVLNEAARVPYKTMPVEELRGVIDSLKNLEHVALRWNKLIDAQRQREFDAAVGDVVGEFEANVDRRPPGRVGTTGEKLRNAGRQFIDLVLNATTILRGIDGFRDAGGAYANIKGPIDDAMNRLTIRKRQAALDLEKLYDVYSRDERRAMSVRKFVPDLGYSLSKWEMISVALNTGNEGNYQRLTDPRVRGSLTDEQVQAVLGNLDERDAKFVQSVWDYLETFRPDIAARERRVTGVEPGWVEAKPVTIAGRELKGGYYPLRYDPRLSSLARDDAENDIAAAMQAGRFGKAQTKNGHLQARAQSSGRDVQLDMSVLHKHVNQVVYDLELSEPVANSWRILQAPPVRDQFIQTGRQADFDALETWLKDVAEGQLGAADWMGSAARTLKSNFTAAKLAFNLGTVALQITGLSQTMVVVGKRDFLRGLQASFRIGVGDEIAAKSAFMSERQTTFNKDITDFYDDPKLGPVASRWGNFKREVMGPASFWLMTKVQWYLVDVPTWLAGYQKGLRKFGGDEAQAIAYADGIVKRAQSSGLFSDRSAIERGSVSRNTRQNDVVRLFTTLGSYMFAKFNVAYERSAVAARTVREEGVSVRAAQEALSWSLDMAFLFTLEAVIGAAIKGGLPDGDDEDDDGWAAFLAKETAFSVMGTIPFIRDAASSLKGFDGGGAYGSAIDTMVKAGKGGWNILTSPFTEDGEVKRTDIKDVINGTGLATGLPATQINRAVDAAWRQSEGEEVGPLEYLLGKAPKK